MKEKLVIIDFLIQDLDIYIFTIDEDTEVDENYIKKLGFNPDNCRWFFGTDVRVFDK